MKGIFITGTDTGVGKTHASVSLISGWRNKGLKVGVMKPCETGCGPEGTGPGPKDAQTLLASSGTDFSLNEVCPYQFIEPMAPAEAAQTEGEKISFKKIEQLYNKISSNHDITLVEGAGGLLVPITGSKTTADLIEMLELPIIIVARSELGTINHTLLTIEAARSREIEVLGVIINRSRDPELFPPGPDEPGNPEIISKMADIKVISVIPYSIGRILPIDYSL